MSSTPVIVLSVVLLIALAVVVALIWQLRNRSQQSAALDPAQLRAVIDQALSEQRQRGSAPVDTAKRPASFAGGTAGTRSTPPADGARHAISDDAGADSTKHPATRAPETAPTDPAERERQQQLLSELAQLRSERDRSAAAARSAEQRVAELTADAERVRERAAAATAAAEQAQQRAAEATANAVTRANEAVQSGRAELVGQQDRLQSSLDQLAQEQRRHSAEREELRRDQAQLATDRAGVAGKQDALRLQAEELGALSEQLADRERATAELTSSLEAELVRIGGLTPEQARAELLEQQQDAVRRDAALLVRRAEADAERTATTRARAIVADAIQRVASDQTAQTVVSVVQLPADELKGRIIGREGRNIRTFETVTGVNVIIDDHPEAVLLSCFDPVRREIGRVTLEELIDDGRIHPQRIEEAYVRATDEVTERCARAAEDALLQVHINDLHPELVKLVGQLKYRTSYGQNVLGHLIETSHIARAMAAELGLDPTVAARGAFLHDIGKALTHEQQGSHALLGAELARRYGESEEVAHCIEAHHDEVPPGTIEAVLTQAADACSGGRPGARRESLEAYVQRLERIEAIAAAKKGVDKVFAMQAGREVRVMVKPEVVDDLEAHVLAREVAKQIEEELTYPGQVRVTVIRESRTSEIAR
ncbi:ribonuclease Y [Nakamurella aerolata]|uniref:Ribonuclease Y n=1 Tax=Nakamurella aerolata TaxID=1656892 RepID=A0A849AC86_9ACTN|nr:ribonuclease Y [Nakamurella aerolata]NNG36100.1 ribonuclease Y [Nakamurella aerolata]